MDVKFLKRNIFQRLFGISATPLSKSHNGWTFLDGKVTLHLDKMAELQPRGGSVRLEGGGLPERILVVHGEDGNFHAFRNRCSHIGHRRLDPVPGTNTVQCCSVNKSTYDIAGTTIYGPAKHAVKKYPITINGEQLTIAIL